MNEKSRPTSYEQLKHLVRRLQWTPHAWHRLQQRGVTALEVAAAIAFGTRRLICDGADRTCRVTLTATAAARLAHWVSLPTTTSDLVVALTLDGRVITAWRTR